VSDLIRRFLKWTLARCTPHPHGRHRARHAHVATAQPGSARSPRTTPPRPQFAEALDGTASQLVRPHLLGDATAHLARRRQRARRRSLYLATWGIDIGAHRIHGVQVATR